MEIMSYEPSLASEVAAVYNRAVAPVPHCYPVGEEEIAQALGPIAAEGEARPRLHSEAAFVAREGRAIAGFVHAAIGPVEEDGAERGSIHFLWYERGRRAAGQALLEVAENDLRAKRMRQIEAFRTGDTYRFYHVSCGHLSDHLEHVQALLKMNGYRPVDGEVIFDWPDYDPAEPARSDVEAAITIEWSAGHSRPWSSHPPAETELQQDDGQSRRPNLRVRAHRDEEQVGVCKSVSCGEFSHAAAAQDWLFVSWLWVIDDLQGRGLGRSLLQRNLQEMHRAGYRHASISTDWENHRAMLFYSNHGFHVVDWTYCYGRELK